MLNRKLIFLTLTSFFLLTNAVFGQEDKIIKPLSPLDEPEAIEYPDIEEDATILIEEANIPEYGRGVRNQVRTLRPRCRNPN